MGTKRIEFIDAMRGFTMLLVVYTHIIFFSYYNSGFDDLSYGGGKLLSFNALFVTFRMPLFFFISGFILYKNDFEWTLPVSGKFLLKKAKIQLIPTFFFLAVYTYIFDISFTNSLFWPDKSGYWFTIALFEFFLSYVLLRIICNKLGYKNGVDWLILAAAVIIYFVRRWYLTSGLYEEPMFLLVGMENLSYFLFFVIGTLARKHYDKIQKFAENGYIVAACLLFFFGVIIYKLHESQEMSSVLSILYLLSRIVGVILVFIFFMKNENLFTQETRLGRALQYVGRRTLDIYLLHYFFLPRNLEPIANFFQHLSKPVAGTLCLTPAVNYGSIPVSAHEQNHPLKSCLGRLAARSEEKSMTMRL